MVRKETEQRQREKETKEERDKRQKKKEKARFRDPSPLKEVMESCKEDGCIHITLEHLTPSMRGNCCYSSEIQALIGTLSQGFFPPRSRIAKLPVCLVHKYTLKATVPDCAGARSPCFCCCGWW